MNQNPSDMLRGLPGYSPQANKVGGDNPQVLTSAQVGAVPSLPGRFFDQLNMPPSPLGLRESALLEAREAVENRPDAIIAAERIAMGVRTGLATNGALAFDPNIEWANARAVPFDRFVRGVVVPFDANAAQLATAAAIEETNRNPASFNSGTPFEEWATITGAGEAIGVDVESGVIAVVDEVGITTWSLQAEHELVWALGVGFSQTADPTTPQNARIMLWPPRRGFPFGSADDPARPNGKGRLSNTAGSTSNTVHLSLMVRFLSTTTPVLSYPHYFEAVVRGWKVPMGRDNRPLAASIGGADASAPSPERT